MAQIQWAVYEPPEKGMPFLAVLVTGVKRKKVQFALPAKTKADAETLLQVEVEEFRAPGSKVRAELHRHYGSPSSVKR